MSVKKVKVKKIIDCPILRFFDDDLPVPYIGGGVGRSCFSANPWQLVSSPNSARGSQVGRFNTPPVRAVLSTGVEAEYVCTLTPRLHRRVRGHERENGFRPVPPGSVISAFVRRCSPARSSGDLRAHVVPGQGALRP